MRLLVLVMMTGIFSVAHAQTELPAGKQTIKILSWNIYMLPGFLGYGKQERAEAIGKMLSKSDYDVIVFQEAFDQSARKIISRYLQPDFSFQAGPANQRLVSFRTNSGLWIFSKHPIVHTASIEFKKRMGIDAMSRKGGLLVELNVNGQHVQVIGTHLQNAGADYLKQRQCAELFDRLLGKFQKPGVPQLVCGDFNIDQHGSPEQYAQMLSALRATNEAESQNMYSYDRVENDLQIESGNSRELIDFILTRNNESSMECSDRIIKRFKLPWHKDHQDLSDHYAIEAKITFQKSADELLVSIHALGSD